MASPAKPPSRARATAGAGGVAAPPAAAASAGTVASASDGVGVASTSSCTHDDTSDHLALPHLDPHWTTATRSLAPLAGYYVEHVLHARRGGPAAAAEPKTRSAKASAAAAKDDTNSIWRAHYVPPDTKAPPIFPSATCVQFLASIRHPSCSAFKLSGKSLVQTLDSVLTPTDRAHFFQVLLPFLAHLALQLPTLFPERACVPRLRRNVDASITLSAAQCATLFACQALSLFARRSEDDDTWPSCNFDAFWSVTRAPMSGKHMLMLNYVARIENPNEGITSNRFVTFQRRVLGASSVASMDDLAQSSVPLTSVEYHPDGCIEDAKHTLQADFANASIGGGVLYTGCVQEEIRFSLSPECVVSMILCESMLDHEAILILGPKMYSTYAGYGTDLKFGSDLPDGHEALEMDECGRLSNVIVAIDAIDYCHNDGSVQRSPAGQWTQEAMEREMLKAYAGFSIEQRLLCQRFKYDQVATGNWGCGAFGGFLPLKFLLQWVSTSLSSRGMQYFSFGNPLAHSIPAFVQGVRDLPTASTVGDLWRAVRTVAPEYARKRGADLTHDGLLQDVLAQLTQQQQQQGRSRNQRAK